MAIRRKDQDGNELLTLREDRFVNEYIANNGNGTRAAIQAGYSKATAAVIASENLNKPKIRETIAERLDQAASVTAKEVIGTLAMQMRGDLTEFFDEDGKISIQKIKERKLGALVKRLRIRRRYEGDKDDRKIVDEIQVELHDSQAAAIQLSRILGLERMSLNVNLSGEIDVTHQIEFLVCSMYRSLRENNYSHEDAVGALRLSGVPAEHLAILEAKCGVAVGPGGSEELVLPERSK